MSTEKNCLDSLNLLRASVNSSLDLQPISKVIREKKGMEKATKHLKDLQEKLKKDYKPEEYYDL